MLSFQTSYVQISAPLARGIFKLRTTDFSFVFISKTGFLSTYVQATELEIFVVSLASFPPGFIPDFVVPSIAGHCRCSFLTSLYTSVLIWAVRRPYSTNLNRPRRNIRNTYTLLYLRVPGSLIGVVFRRSAAVACNHLSPIRP